MGSKPRWLYVSLISYVRNYRMGNKFSYQLILISATIPWLVLLSKAWSGPYKGNGSLVSCNVCLQRVTRIKTTLYKITAPCVGGNFIIYIYISSSSCHATSTDFPDPLSSFFSIVHRSRQVFQATSCISTELLKIGSSLLPNSCSSMWRGLLEYIGYEFILTSPAVSRMFCSYNLDGFRNGLLVAVSLLFWGVLPPGFVQYSS